MLENKLDINGYILNRLSAGIASSDIIADMALKGYDEVFVRDMVAEAVKVVRAKKRIIGLALILCGAAVCFASFLLTITGIFPQGNLTMVLYGLTTLGVLLVFGGLTQIF